MLQKYKDLMMADGRRTVEEFIASHPQESRPYLTSAVSECLRRRYPLNACELESMAREVRYDWSRTA